MRGAIAAMSDEEALPSDSWSIEQVLVDQGGAARTATPRKPCTENSFSAASRMTGAGSFPPSSLGRRPSRDAEEGVICSRKEKGPQWALDLKSFFYGLAATAEPVAQTSVS
jgi:hypothetical protein